MIKQSADVIIIGGGISGLSSALALEAEGLQVMVLERNRSGMESSWAGGGILSPLLPWHYSSPVNVLCDTSNAVYAAWLDDLRADAITDPEYWRCGMRILPIDDLAPAPPDQTRCDTHHVIQPQHNTLFLPNIAQARNPRLVRTLREATLARGIRLIENAGDVRLQHGHHQITRAETATDAYQAPHYLIAAGAWSEQPAPFALPQRHIHPVRGQMLLFYLPETLHEIYYRNGIYLIPRRDGHILAGSTLEHVGFDKSTTTDAARQLQADAIAMLPALRGQPVVHHWSGLRPGSPDNIPTISQHPNLHNLYMNAGHFRYGVTMAPASAALIRDIILQRPPAISPDAYAWEAPQITPAYS